MSLGGTRLLEGIYEAAMMSGNNMRQFIPAFQSQTFAEAVQIYKNQEKQGVKVSRTSHGVVRAYTLFERFKDSAKQLLGFPSCRELDRKPARDQLIMKFGNEMKAYIVLHTADQAYKDLDRTIEGIAEDFLGKIDKKNEKINNSLIQTIFEECVKNIESDESANIKPRKNKGEIAPLLAETQIKILKKMRELKFTDLSLLEKTFLNPLSNYLMPQIAGQIKIAEKCKKITESDDLLKIVKTATQLHQKYGIEKLDATAIAGLWVSAKLLKGFCEEDFVRCVPHVYKRFQSLIESEKTKHLFFEGFSQNIDLQNQFVRDIKKELESIEKKKLGPSVSGLRSPIKSTPTPWFGRNTDPFAFPDRSNAKDPSDEFQ